MSALRPDSGGGHAPSRRTLSPATGPRLLRAPHLTRMFASWEAGQRAVTVPAYRLAVVDIDGAPSEALGFAPLTTQGEQPRSVAAPSNSSASTGAPQPAPAALGARLIRSGAVCGAGASLLGLALASCLASLTAAFRALEVTSSSAAARSRPEVRTNAA